jgi:hypothetical protein
MTGVVITGEETIVAEVVTTGVVKTVAAIAGMNPGNQGLHRKITPVCPEKILKTVGRRFFL